MVGAIVADHLGELNSNYEVLRGVDIVKAYLNSGGTGACMSKAEAGYTLAKGHHPSEVYDMPNISMAVLRNDKGDITARSMLYDASETDKRFIRVYGDAKLKKMLVRAGYKAGAWHGAEFKAIRLDPARDTINLVMPYLDGNGAPGSTTVSYVAYVGGKLLAISYNLACKYHAKFGPPGAVCATNTSGVCALKEIMESDVNAVCPLSGKNIGLEDASVLFWLNGAIVSAHPDAIEDGPYGNFIARRTKGGSLVNVFAPMDVPTFTNERGTQSIDSDEQRMFDGQLKLSAVYYPDEQGWLSAGCYETFPAGTKKDRNGQLIKAVDAVSIICMSEEGQPIKSTVHQQEVSKGWIKVHSLHRGQDLYAMPDVLVHKTISGRKVVNSIHAVKKTYKSQWEFTRNLTAVRVGHMTFFVAKGDEVPSINNQLGISLLRADYETMPDLRKSIYRLIRKNYSYVYVNNNYVNNNYVQTYSEDNFPLEAGMSDPTSGMSSDITVKLMYYVLQLREAEANAIDYNDQHAGPTVLPVPTNLPQPSAVLAGETNLPGYATGETFISTGTASWLGTSTTTPTYTPVYHAVTAASVV
jgi:hypothetical protein